MMKLPTKQELIAQGYPFGKASDDIPLGDPAAEWQRTEPDVIVYRPAHDDADDCDNCVLAVIPSFRGDELLAIWTQGPAESHDWKHRIVISRTSDGEHWSRPEFVTGGLREEEKQSVWGMPMYTKRGRLYLFYIQEPEKEKLDPLYNRIKSGYLGISYSDDDGHTWVHGTAPLPRSPEHDNPDSNICTAWWGFQPPIRDASDKMIVGHTIIKSDVTQRIHRDPPHQETYAAFLTFENLEEHPEPEDVVVSIDPPNGLFVPDILFPDQSVAEEPSPVLLPDGRLFATMRTLSGYIYYTVREADGHWRKPEPLLGFDGSPVPHPQGPCPCYPLQDGRFLCVTHNNPASRAGRNCLVLPVDPVAFCGICRNPLYFMLGEYDPDAKQPLRFGKPQEFLNTGDIALGMHKRTPGLAAYGSVTQWKGKTFFWYPDRKYYILGKELKSEFFRTLEK